MSEKKLCGKLPRECFGMLEVPRYPREIIDAFMALEDMSGAVSDALDEHGIEGCVPGSTLPVTLRHARICGPALTLRNVPQRNQPFKDALERVSKMAEIEAHNLAQRGDVLVLQGVDKVSNMGGISASIAHRQGVIGAIVDGGIRDVSQTRDIAFPVWSRGPCSITGKWRLQTVAVNQTVSIDGVQCAPGDLVIADEGGVCFVPRNLVPSVLKRAQEIIAGEARRYADIRDGMSVPELANKTHVFKFGS
ncbi:RraA family protein [Peristeroidobacter soli]|uniref:RraA family protein n=1 Tax=Peristeroidobacter soli TaxID=2497877 RepID=UPI00101B5C12|nr:RraA family protein [Peristeroidobacter soli]